MTGVQTCALPISVRVVVNNAMKHRWLNPSKDIEIQPNSTMDVGELKAYVDSYILRVKPIGDPTRNDINMHGLTLRGAWVEIARYKIYDSEAAGRDVVERKRVELKEGVDFSVPRHTTNRNDLIYFDLPNDLHIMTFTSDSTGEHAFHPDRIFYPRDYYKREYELRRVKEQRAAVRCSDTYHRYSGEFHFTSSFKRTVCEVPIVMTPKNPIVSGRLLDSENLGRGVDGTVYLVTQSYNYKGEKETKHYDKYFEKGFFGSVIASRETSASNQGYFVFDNLNLTREITYDNPEYSDHKKDCRIRIEQLAKEKEDRLEELEKERQKEISNPRIISRGTGRHPRIKRESTASINRRYKHSKNKVEKEYGDRIKKLDQECKENTPALTVKKEVQNEYALYPSATGYSLLRAREQKGLKDTADVELNRRVWWFPEGGFTLKMGQQMFFPQILMEPQRDRKSVV